MATTIVYHSVYGSTKRYADALDEKLRAAGIDVTDSPQRFSAEGFTLADVSQGSTVIVLTPVFGPNVEGSDVAVEAAEAGCRVALVTVGLTDPEKAAEHDFSARGLGRYVDTIKRFYVPGRVNMEELSTPHSAAIRGLVGVYTLKPNKTQFEKDFAESKGRNFDRVDVDRMDDVVAWVRGE